MLRQVQRQIPANDMTLYTLTGPKEQLACFILISVVSQQSVDNPMLARRQQHPEKHAHQQSTQACWKIKNDKWSGGTRQQLLFAGWAKPSSSASPGDFIEDK
jgi:hypothetical protein